MASFLEIYNIEEPVSLAIRELLLSADGSLILDEEAAFSVYLQETESVTQDEEPKLPRIEVSVTSGGNTNHMKSIGGGFAVFSEWQVGVQFNIITERSANRTLHRDLRGKVRKVMHTTDNATFNAQLDYHDMMMVQEMGSSHSVDDENDHDITTLNFNMILRVRENAWPA